MTSLAFQTLGRSGLAVSRLTLGTMTFGRANWGSPDDVSRAIFDAYVESGGNVIDTADVYADGRSEELVGQFIAERGLRDQLVLATKFGFQAPEPEYVHGGGNGRKNMHRALEGSLRRLGTDYVDLYWMHVWDRVTPVEEVLQSLGDLVRAGKIRYFGFSDVPAWYATKAATLAAAHAIPGPIALQLEYSLVERTIEQEHVPAAREDGLGICPWSPLGGGLLSGKYQRDGENASGDGRVSMEPGRRKLTERHWRIIDEVRAVATQLGRSPSQVALAWASAQHGITSVILGASKLDQLHDNLTSSEIALSAEQMSRLDAASALEPAHPYSIFTDQVNRDAVFGGATVTGWR